MKGKYVVVRTYSAGVHVGTLVAKKGREVTLRNARRIWQWTGAFTLSEISQKGIAATSKVSCVVPTIALTEAVEIIPCSAAGKKSLQGIAEYKL